MAPNISMLDIDELRKTKLKPYIVKSLELRAPDPAFHAIMGHNVDLAEALNKILLGRAPEMSSTGVSRGVGNPKRGG